jgi:3-hydroxyacyl-CoA dehydrogenase
VAYAEKLIADGAPLVKVRDRNDKVTGVDTSIFDAARKKFAKTRRGFNAPQECIDAVEAATTLSFDDGIKKEQEIFAGALTSVQSQAQRHIFFSERLASKIDDVPKDTPILDVKSVTILGAGTMGGGIAMNFVNAGISVFMTDTTQEFLDRGMGIITKNYARTVSKGRLSQEDMNKRMALITPTLDMNTAKDVDMVVEAVFEEMGVKKEIFAKLDGICRPDAIMATNTSTLDVNEIASATSRPQQVIGTHFFSPANVMKLLEVVRGDKTSNEVLATTMAIAKRIAKVPVVVGVCDGFVGNRMLHQYAREAQFLLEEGALPQDVDRVLYNYGLAMGPFTMNDLAGLDVSWRIRRAKGIPKGVRYCAIADRLCEEGRFGQKTRNGWYLYEEGSRVPVPDPYVEELIRKEAERNGIERREITDDEILERCLYPLVNEGAKILEEGFAQRASDIDVIYIYGYGYPVHRGGPMFWANTVGLKKVYGRICEFHEKHGEFWKPAPLLKKLAEEGGAFK